MSQSGGKIPGNEERALAAFYQGEYPAAIEEYERLVAVHKEKTAWVLDLAAAMMAEGRFADAAKVLKQNRLYGLRTVEAVMAEGDRSTARKILQEMLESPEPPRQTRIYLGLVEYLDGNYAESAEQLWRAKDINPKQGSIHLMLGRAFQALATQESVERDYFVSRAKQEYNRAITLDPSLWQVHRDLAFLATDSKNIKKALRHWRRVKSTIGNADEVKLAIAGLMEQLPVPTMTATPKTLVIKAAPKPPVFGPIAAQAWQVNPGDPVIKVGLGNKLSRIAFGCTGAWRARDHRGRLFWEGLGERGYRIEKDTRGRWWLKNWEGKPFKQIRKKITLEPVDSDAVLAVFDLFQTSGYFWSVGGRKTRYYRGKLQIKTARKRITLLNLVSLEEYLISVVPGEMPALWPLEALKTQVVVARTDTLLRRGTHRKQGYDVCNNAHCAMYKGVTAEHPRSHQAVLETRRLVVMKGNRKLLPTFYSHSCGGMTQSNQEAWWKKLPEPSQPGGIYDMDVNSSTCRALPLRPGSLNQWLSDSPDVFCNAPRYSAPRNFRWLKILTQAELTAVLDRRYNIGAVREVKIIERSPSAYVRKIYVSGDEGNVIVRGDRIRSSLGGLRSNLFTLFPVGDKAHPYAWLVWGGGWGHGVGLCQVGAGQMGREGYTYQEILKHYFPEGSIEIWP
ncbi:SpoIID/LytB domain-containing protein [bacterium]|nr:SpoIID/LytB domain-containing protein [bacterium]